MQPEFNRPEFLEGNSAEEIHERMMNNLPDDITICRVVFRMI